MGGDVHDIQTQSKGLQTTSNNQKKLCDTLETLFSSLEVAPLLLDVLINEPLAEEESIKKCIRSIKALLVTINGEIPSKYGVIIV